MIKPFYHLSLLMLTIILLVACSTSIKQADLPEKTLSLPGSASYVGRCAHCHDNNGFGEQAMEARRGHKKARLVNRDDLSAEFIRSVVRNGYLAMPPLSRAEVSNTELEEIIHFLVLE